MIGEGAMDLDVRGVANQATEIDMIISKIDGTLVPIVMHHGVHVCWGCMEQFDEEERDLRLTEMRTPGSVRVAVHRKCVDPKNRKVFSDMGGSRELQSVQEVSRGLKIRRMVAKAVRPFVQAAEATATKIIL